MKTLYELTDLTIAVCGNEYASYVRKMVECLSLIEPPMPDVVLDAWRVARGYWFQNSQHKAELEQARIACWKYVDATSSSTDFQDPMTSAVRATICVLFPDAPSKDNGDIVLCFLEFLHTAVGGDIEEFCELVNRVINSGSEAK